MFSLESPHRGDSNGYKQYTIFNIKTKITLIYPKSAATRIFFLGTQERVRNSYGTRAISVQATEVLLYYAEWAYIQGKQLCYFVPLLNRGPSRKK